MLPIWSTERKIVLGFGSALLALCVVVAMSVWLTLSLLGDLAVVSDQSRIVSEQNDILSRISEVNAMVPQLATYARLYAANLDDKPRAEKTFGEWQGEELNFERTLAELDVRTSDSSAQRERMAKIVALLQAKVRITTRTASREGLGHAWADWKGPRAWGRAHAKSREELENVWGIVNGMSQMRPLSDELNVMSVEERNLLGAKNQEAINKNGDAQHAANAALWTIGIAFSMAMLLIAGAVATILRDLRARRRAAEELDRARQAAEGASIAKSAFLANMSHELRTPLASIMGYVDLMLDPSSTAAGRPEYLQTIRRSDEHLLNLINDILDVSKIEAGRMTLEAVECRLVDLLADVDSLMRSRAIGKAIDFCIEYLTPIPERAKTDPTRFRQILVNLVGNAIKFTDEGSVRLTVSCKDAAMNSRVHRIVVEVIDTGVGISAEQRRHLFQPFSQADVSTTRRFGGTGLGLSISRRLAQMLGGDLAVRSELGKGSTFRLSVPMDAVQGSVMIPPGQARHLVQSTGQAPDGRPRALGLRVLVAEDGAENRDVILLHLRHAGCTAAAVEDGQQAFEAAMQAARNGAPFDILLMDMQMPVMDGYTATSKLRAQGYRGAIIALTANAMKEDRDRCIRVGCDEYASKPVNIPQLLQMMSRLSGGKGDTLSVMEKLLENPALRQLTRKFCDGIPLALGAMRQWADKSAWEELAGAAHRMAGAGGAYGFDDITRQAKVLERAARTADSTRVNEALKALSQTCATARARIESTGDATTAPLHAISNSSPLGN